MWFDCHHLNWLFLKYCFATFFPQRIPRSPRGAWGSIFQHTPNRHFDLFLPILTLLDMVYLYFYYCCWQNSWVRSFWAITQICSLFWGVTVTILVDFSKFLLKNPNFTYKCYFSIFTPQNSQNEMHFFTPNERTCQYGHFEPLFVTPSTFLMI